MSAARRQPGSAGALRPHVLLVGDDADLCRRIAKYFSEFDLRVSCARDAVAMQTRLAEHIFDLVLLDLMLPGKDGITLARDLRARSAMPIIMLSGRADEIDRIMSLELGADDYVAKPFNLRELVARVRAVLRRTQARSGPSKGAEALRGFRFAGWELDLRTRRLASTNGDEIELTLAELGLLRAFLGAPQRVLSRDELFELSRGHSDEVVVRSIDVLILRLRRKIEANPSRPDIVKTSRGAGYYFNARVETVG
jgi:DNA-binding response OmpR family regulator